MSAAAVRFHDISVRSIESRVRSQAKWSLTVE
jgi:hypothetical protein